MPENLNRLNEDLERLQHWMIDTRQRLASAHVPWREDDARLTIFNKYSNVASSSILGVAFMTHHLRSPMWWKEKGRIPATRETMQYACDEFNMFLRVSFIQGIFFAVESSLRVFVRALDPKACSGGCADFKSIYEWLLKRLKLQIHRDLLDLVRNIRNVMHNNGLFFPISGKDISITYAGIDYSFRVGRPNDFVTWALATGLALDLGNAVYDIIEADELRNIRRIAEPS